MTPFRNRGDLLRQVQDQDRILRHRAVTMKNRRPATRSICVERSTCRRATSRPSMLAIPNQHHRGRRWLPVDVKRHNRGQLPLALRPSKVIAQGNGTDPCDRRLHRGRV